MENDLYNGFKKKLKDHIKVERELNLLRNMYDEELKNKRQLLNVHDWLKENNYEIDVRLEQEYLMMKNELIKIETIIKENTLLYDKLGEELGNPKNLRHVVWCLCKEENITLEQLAKILETEEDTFIQLCHNGFINKENYVKLCNYFELDMNNPRYIRYCHELTLERRQSVY
jgi:hypothetical protein